MCSPDDACILDQCLQESMKPSAVVSNSMLTHVPIMHRRTRTCSATGGRASRSGGSGTRASARTGSRWPPRRTRSSASATPSWSTSPTTTPLSRCARWVAGQGAEACAHAASHDGAAVAFQAAYKPRCRADFGCVLQACCTSAMDTCWVPANVITQPKPFMLCDACIAGDGGGGHRPPGGGVDGLRGRQDGVCIHWHAWYAECACTPGVPAAVVPHWQCR